MNRFTHNVRLTTARYLWTAVCFVIAALLVASPRATAQDYRARLIVTVTDSTGAVIPNAALDLKRGSTGQTTAVKSDALGSFLFQFLEPDTYSLSAAAPGMGTNEVTGIVLHSYAATSVSVQLKPAAANSEVTVTAEGAMLQTESASRAWNIDNKTIEELPVINGNTVMLGQDIPGVYMRPLGIYTDPWTVTSQFLINGGLMYLNEFQIDGSPNDAELGANTYAYTPPQYATKEFSVNANNYEAQYGHTSGGVINMTTLSGTDKLHGMGWSSFRRTGWNANTSQNKYENWVNNTTSNTTPFNTQTQLGFQVGGPVAIPHLLHQSERYKPYFFFAYDHYTELLPRGLLLSYPTTKMRTGDFSELLDQPGYAPITIYDPESVYQNGAGAWVRNPFPGNVIPQSRLNPISLAIAKMFPAVGNTPAGQRIGTNNLALPNNYFNWHFQNLLARFDFNIGDKYKFYIRPADSKFTEVSNAGGIVGPGENGGQFSRAAKGILGDFIDVINPSTVLNVRAGYMRFSVVWASPANQGFDLTSLGLPSGFVNSLQKPPLFGNWNFQGYNGMGWFANTENTGTFSLEDDLSKTIGKHNIRIGSDLRLTRFNFYNPGSTTFNSNADWTQNTWAGNSPSPLTGDGLATFLLGTPSTGNTTINADEFISTWYMAPWIQDDWRVNQHLTFNLGLRYDVLTGPVDRNNALITGFDPNVPNAVQAFLPPNAAQILPAASNLTGGLTFANVDGGTRSATATVYGNIQPRFGFAWQPTQKMVVRGGYGVFYTNFQNNGMIQQLGFSSNSPLITSTDGGIHQLDNVLNNPYPTGLIQPTGASLRTMTGLGNNLSVYNHNYRIPDANEFSLGVQYHLLKNGLFEAAYVGNRMIGYDMTYNANLPNHDFLQTCSLAWGSPNANWNNCWAGKGNPFNGVAPFAGTDYFYNGMNQAYDMARPHPEFHDVNVSGMNGGHSWYNGLQIDYRQRMSHGLAFDASYVWSKQIEQWGWLSQDLNIRQRSVYAEGLPKSLKINGVYQLPVGRKRAFNMGNNRIADAIVGGWDVSGDFTIQSGEPIAVPSGARPLPHNTFNKHPNWHQNNIWGWGTCVLHYQPSGADPVPLVSNNSAAGCAAKPLSEYDWMVYDTLPNEAVEGWNSGVMHMKPMVLSDAALQKSFEVHEGINAILRISSSNVMNHFNILTARFNSNAWDPNFGLLVPGQTPSADAPPRNVNVQFRVTF
jgi:hypothetical protein